MAAVGRMHLPQTANQPIETPETSAYEAGPTIKITSVQLAEWRECREELGMSRLIRRS
jgi:hypothetical protein